MDAPAPDTPGDPRDDSAASTEHGRFLASIAVVAALGLWIPQLTSSLWADETVTHWIIKGSLHQAVSRASTFEGESPVYFVIANVWRRLFGSGELALRLPSLLAVAGAAFVVYRIGRRLADDETGILAAIVFVATPGMTFAAGDARPYPIAIFALAASTLALIRWVDDRRGTDAGAYVVLTALALYFHYFAVTALIAHPIFVFLRDRRLLARYVAMVVAVGVLMIPALPHIRSLVHRRGSLAVPVAVSPTDYFTVLAPALLIGSIALGVLVARLRNPVVAGRGASRAGYHALAVAWWLIPPTILYAVTRAGSTTLFEPRFFFFATAGLALLVAGIMRRLEPATARSTIAVVLVLAAFWGFSSRTHSGDDWRAAAAVERSLADPTTPVLFRPNFIEASQLDWLTRPDKRAYLLSETSPYPMRGTIVAIPYALNLGAQRYLDGVIRERLTRVDRFLLVNDRGDFRLWLEGRLPDFKTKAYPQGRLVGVVLFERAP